MKSERGVTLTSLIIYVIAMLITVTIISVITSYFYQNIQTSTEKYSSLGEYTRFSSYFSEEVNKDDNKVLEVGNIYEKDENGNNKQDEDGNNIIEQHYVAFSSGNQYTYIPSNKAIYQNNVKITSGVEKCTFEEIIKNGKTAISVKITIGEDVERTVEYILKN